MSLDIPFYSPLDEAIRSRRSTFWDDITTPGREGEAEVWGRALRAAWADLKAYAPEPEDQRLDRVRHLTFPHAFAKVPILGALFSVGPVPMAGDGFHGTVELLNGGPPGYRAGRPGIPHPSA